VRRCVGCRRRATKPELIRLAAVDGRLVLDRAAKLPGRGAWVCRDRACLEGAIERRAFARALRAPVAVTPELLESVTDGE
jgi:predicted RNA-binding protein YlxR (DUF448 family)